MMYYFIFSVVGWVVVLLVIFVLKPWDDKKLQNTRNGRIRMPPPPPQPKRQGKTADTPTQRLMTYDEYREAVAGAEQNYVMLFDTDEQRARFLEAIRAGGDAIRMIDGLRKATLLPHNVVEWKQNGG